MEIKDISIAFVINLARREDRRDAFWQAWQGDGEKSPLSGIPAQLYTACDGSEFEPPKSWDVGRGAYGCYLSHLSLLTEVIRNGSRYVFPDGPQHFLVFEDDARPVENFRELFAAALADLPDDFDQMYLGWQAINTRRRPPAKLTEHLGRAGNCNRNHATLWSRRGAIRFLARLTNLAERKAQHHLDHWLGELHEELTADGRHAYNSYIAIPQLCYQAEGTSDISGRKTIEHLWYYRGNYTSEEKENGN